MARVTNIVIVLHQHFSRCSRPNRQNVTLYCPSPQSYWPDKGPEDSCSPALPATLCCLNLNRWLHLCLHLATKPTLVVDRKHTADAVAYLLLLLSLLFTLLLLLLFNLLLQLLLQPLLPLLLRPLLPLLLQPLLPLLPPPQVSFSILQLSSQRVDAVDSPSTQIKLLNRYSVSKILLRISDI